jgi:SET domain-containing protein
VEFEKLPEQVCAKLANTCTTFCLRSDGLCHKCFQRKARVIALRDISPGEELFVDYGKWYWASIKGAARMKGAPQAGCGHLPDGFGGAGQH